MIWGAGRNWDVGGPVVFHAPWWIEQHWGRGFEVVRYDDSPSGAAALGLQSAVLLRAKPEQPTPEALRWVDPDQAGDVDASHRADEIRDVAGPRAFDADHRLADVARSTITACDPSLRNVGLDISSQDDMYLYILDLATTAREAVTSYFSVGLDILSIIDRIVSWRFDGWQNVPSVLDVGSGFGRVTRFMVHRLPATRVTVADIQPAAVQFQSHTFGVTPLVTQTDTIAVPEGAAYGLVSVVSLFTHLPRHRFVPWLRRLWQLVDPGGVLVFSTHNAEPPPRGITLEADGFAYLPRNEIPALDVAEYGNTYTSDAYVRAAITAACEGDQPAVIERMTRAVGIQDFYVLGRIPSAAPLVNDRAPPWGSVDRAVVAGTEVVVEGWAADPTGTRAAGVAVLASLDGRSVPVRTGIKRDDVAAFFHRRWDLDLLFSGWQLELPAEQRGARLLVEVQTAGTSIVIHDGPPPLE